MPNRFRVTATCLVAILRAAALPAQDRLPPDARVQAILDEQVGPKHTVGVVAGLLDADGRARIVAAGRSDNASAALDGNTVFEIGSITKTFTTAVLADMVRRGEVKLDDPVATYLPAGVTMPSRNGRQITLLDLATASSGLPSLPDNFTPADPTNPYADYTVDSMYAFLGRYTLTRDIGAQYEYSNLGMGLLGHVLARRAGMSYFELLRTRILEPLGMRDTRIEFTPDMRRRLALGHDKGGTIVANWDLPTLAAAGALRSTVNDMLTYLRANLDTARAPLGPTLAATQASRRPTTFPNMTIGLAWHILKAPGGGSIVWHNGGTGGYRTYTGFDPARRAGVVILSNSSISVDDVGFHLLDSLVPLSKPPVPHVEVAVDATVLARYVGTYQLSPTLSIVVTLDGASLVFQATDQPALRGRPSSDREFFFPEVDAQVRFVVDGAGAVTGLVLLQGSDETPGRKVR